MLTKEDYAVIKALKKRGVYIKDIAIMAPKIWTRKTRNNVL